MFGTSVEKWKELNGFNTTTEIYGQPELWIETLKIVESNRERLG